MARLTLNAVEVAVNSGTTIDCNKSELHLLDDYLIQVVGKKTIIEFRDMIIDGIVDELKDMSSKSKMSYKDIFIGARREKEQGSLREQIIRNIEKNNPKGKEGIKISKGKITAKIVIDHPLAAALNYGTGIYNPDNPHLIHPVNKKYMFLPGVVFKEGWDKRKTNKAMKERSSALINFYKNYGA